jgi:hypothetical protein
MGKLGIYPHKIKDETGKRYGMLTVIEKSDYKGKGEHAQRWRCECDCGGVIIARGRELRGGRTSSCGCQRYIKAGIANRKDLTGMVFGNVTAIRNTGEKKDGNYLWECICVCGNHCFYRTSNLLGGAITSCGCWRLPITEGRQIERLYNSYKNKAEEKDRIFDISLKEFVDFIKGNCFYCGNPPSQIIKRRNGRIYPLVYNGIDRVNNDVGYIKSNCVTCCGKCNHMKFKMDKEDFLSHINNIYLYQSLKNKV